MQVKAEEAGFLLFAVDPACAGLTSRGRGPPLTPRIAPLDCGAACSLCCQKSIRITTRRSVGLLTSLKPAAAKMLRVPTWSSSRMTSVVIIG